MKFHAPAIGDASWAVPLLEANNYMGSEFAFSNVFMWQDYVDTKIARFNDFVVIKIDYKDENILYQYPGGIGDIRPVIKAIIDVAKEEERIPVITAVPDEGMGLLEELYPGMFSFTNPRGNNDYVYLTEDLANLRGGKFKKKRNHCSHFERSYPNWKFFEIDEGSLDDIYSFTERWMNQHKSIDVDGINGELTAIRRAVENFKTLGLKGGYIKVDDEIISYSYGCPMGDEFIIHVEKALYKIHGGYAFINRQMARTFGREYTYINREDDVDDPGIRRAKLSYRPAFLVNKWRAEFKSWPPQL